MVIDSISPTFSIPSINQYFEISTDNGITYTDASIIEVNYYALNKMNGFSGDTNPLNLLFRKKSNITDEKDYRITKILVNEASSFLPSPNTGLNVESTGTQNAQSPYLAGRYATYNSVTTGGLNFSDFKIQSINNTAMQIVFFVTPMGGLEINFIAESVTHDNFVVTCNFNSGGGKRTVHVGDTLNFVTSVSINCTGGWELEDSGSYSFQYNIKTNDVLNFNQTPTFPTYTSPYSWSVIVDEIIWNGTPTITVAPMKFTADLKRVYDTYWVYGIDNYLLWKLQDGNWVYDGTPVSQSGITPYDGTTYAVYKDNGYWRFKQPYNNSNPNSWPAYNYAIDSLPNGKYGQFTFFKTVTYNG